MQRSLLIVSSNIRKIESNDHQRSIRYILPIFVPSFAELWAKRINFSFCGTELALCITGSVDLRDTYKKKLIRTTIHCIGSKQLIVVCDSFRDVESPVCKSVDTFSWIQARAIRPE